MSDLKLVESSKRLYKSNTKVSVEIVQDVDVKKISVMLQHNTGNLLRVITFTSKV